MDVLLVEGSSAHAKRLLARLEMRTHRIVRLAESPIANGSFWPSRSATEAILLGFDAPSIEKLRVLKRLWAADCNTPSFIVTSPGSAGEAMLSAVIGLAVPGTSTRLRAARSLPLERVIALERLIVAAATR